MNLTIKKSKVKGICYYQIGRYDKGKWVLVEHMGTAETILKLVRLGKEKTGTTH